MYGETGGSSWVFTSWGSTSRFLYGDGSSSVDAVNVFPQQPGCIESRLFRPRRLRVAAQAICWPTRAPSPTPILQAPHAFVGGPVAVSSRQDPCSDRKSTRLNSSHL